MAEHGEFLERLETLNAIGVALSSERDTDSLLERILEAAREFADADGGTLEVLADRAKFKARDTATADLTRHHAGTGRELFTAFRAITGRADQGASIFGSI